MSLPSGGVSCCQAPAQKKSKSRISLELILQNWTSEFETNIKPHSGVKLKVGSSVWAEQTSAQTSPGWYKERPLPPNRLPIHKEERMTVDNYTHEFFGNRNAHRYLIITTSDSFINHVVTHINYKHHFSMIQSTRNNLYTFTQMQFIFPLICSFIAEDEAHKWVSRDKRPWSAIKLRHKLRTFWKWQKRRGQSGQRCYWGRQTSPRDERSRSIEDQKKWSGSNTHHPKKGKGGESSWESQITRGLLEFVSRHWSTRYMHMYDIVC